MERFWKANAANRALALLRDLSEVGGNLGWKCFTGLLLSACTRHLGRLTCSPPCHQCHLLRDGAYEL